MKLREKFFLKGHFIDRSQKQELTLLKEWFLFLKLELRKKKTTTIVVLCFVCFLKNYNALILLLVYLTFVKVFLFFISPFFYLII